MTGINEFRGTYNVSYGTFGYASSGAITPVSGTNIAIPGLSHTFTVLGPSATLLVWMVADVLINTTGTVNIVEMLVDAVAQSGSIQTSNGATGRATGAQMWIVTGLAAGSHTLTAQSRNTAGATSATINPTHTKLVVLQVV